MNSEELVILAARNNAEWCDLVCGTHGVKGTFGSDVWTANGAVPKYYPNTVTLAPTKDGGISIMQSLEDLMRTEGTISVKDSFNDLDLSLIGFEELFYGEWLLLPSEHAMDLDDIDWKVVETPETLSEWELSWGGDGDAIFKPTLIDNEKVRIVGIYKNGKIVAGAIFNTSETVFGISNVFYPENYGEEYWPMFIAIANTLFPKMSGVGYESGNDLVVAKNAGLHAIGKLKVWVRP